MERLKMIPRWQDNSCINCEPIKLSSNEDFLHNFFDQIIKVPDVNDSITKLGDTSHRVSTYNETVKNYFNFYKAIFRKYYRYTRLGKSSGKPDLLLNYGLN